MPHVMSRGTGGAKLRFLSLPDFVKRRSGDLRQWIAAMANAEKSTLAFIPALTLQRVALQLVT
jgi:hypothetical protein